MSTELEAEVARLREEVGRLQKRKNVKHSKGDPNWTTPADYLARIRATMGGRIGLDPFSSEIAQKNVQADRYFTPTDDGFAQPWVDCVHINAPGLKIKQAWLKLCAEITAGRVDQAVWTGFSTEQLCILVDPRPTPRKKKGVPPPEPVVETDAERWARGGFYPMDFSTVILRKRISFVQEDGTTGAPAHGNFITGIGVDHAEFVRIWGPLGRVVRGPLAVGMPPPGYTL